VRKVAYKVENTRVGQSLDYDKLTMTIETNGAVTPDDALAYAARILQDQLQLFVNFEEPRKKVDADRRSHPAEPPFNPAATAQEGGRARAVGALGQLPEERQHRLHRRPGAEDRGGDAAHPELRPQVAERDQGSAGRMGLHLGMDMPGWPPENIEELAKKGAGIARLTPFV
jgi:DNA-directed RNA polymerase subunit alpha